MKLKNIIKITKIQGIKSGIILRQYLKKCYVSFEVKSKLIIGLLDNKSYQFSLMSGTHESEVLGLWI